MVKRKQWRNGKQTAVSQSKSDVFWPIQPPRRPTIVDFLVLYSHTTSSFASLTNKSRKHVILVKFFLLGQSKINVLWTLFYVCISVSTSLKTTTQRYPNPLKFLPTRKLCPWHFGQLKMVINGIYQQQRNSRAELGVNQLNKKFKWSCSCWVQLGAMGFGFKCHPFVCICCKISCSLSSCAESEYNLNGLLTATKTWIINPWILQEFDTCLQLCDITSALIWGG